MPAQESFYVAMPIRRMKQREAMWGWEPFVFTGGNQAEGEKKVCIQ